MIQSLARLVTKRNTNRDVCLAPRTHCTLITLTGWKSNEECFSVAQAKEDNRSPVFCLHKSIYSRMRLCCSYSSYVQDIQKGILVTAVRCHIHENCTWDIPFTPCTQTNHGWRAYPAFVWCIGHAGPPKNMQHVLEVKYRLGLPVTWQWRWLHGNFASAFKHPHNTGGSLRRSLEMYINVGGRQKCSEFGIKKQNN